AKPGHLQQAACWRVQIALGGGLASPILSLIGRDWAEVPEPPSVKSSRFGHRSSRSRGRRDGNAPYPCPVKHTGLANQQRSADAPPTDTAVGTPGARDAIVRKTYPCAASLTPMLIQKPHELWLRRVQQTAQARARFSRRVSASTRVSRPSTDPPVFLGIAIARS